MSARLIDIEFMVPQDHFRERQIQAAAVQDVEKDHFSCDVDNINHMLGLTMALGKKKNKSVLILTCYRTGVDSRKTCTGCWRTGSAAAEAIGKHGWNHSKVHSKPR